MLDRLFMQILDMTGVGSIVILAVLLLRLCLKKAPKVLSYALWAVVLLRLLCPVSIPSPVSVMPEVSSVSDSYTLADEPISLGDAGIAAYRAVGDVLNGGIDMQRVPTQRQDADGNTEYVRATFGEVWILFGKYVWLAGAVGMLGWSLVSWLKLRKRLKVSVAVDKDVWIADDFDTPFVMGIFRPRIYLPGTITGKEQAFILMHERHHIRRLDPLWKLLGFFALTLHWMNPLVWLAFSLASRDMEMSCDEAVIRRLGSNVRQEYAASLLSLATEKRTFGGMPLAFGEGDPGGRIKNLAKWKKPTLWVTAVLVLLCGILAVCLLTDPASKEQEKPQPGRYWYYGIVDTLETGGDQESGSGNRACLRLTMADESSMVIWLNQWCSVEEISPGDYVSVSALVEEETGLTVASQVEKRDRIRYGSLDEGIPGAILDRNRSSREEAFFACASFITLANEEGGPAKEMSHGMEPVWYTYYGIALHQLYSMKDGVLTEESGSHIPTVLSFVRCEDGMYELTACWQPRDGTYYARDIREKYPLGVYPDTQKYIAQQRAECLSQARQHFSVSQQPAEPEQNQPDSTVPVTQPEQTVALPEVLPEGIPGVVVYGTKLEELPERYTPRQAAADGCVVMMDGDVWANEDIWTAFCVITSRWTLAKVRVAEYTADEKTLRIYEICGSSGHGFLYRLLQEGAVSEQPYRWLAADFVSGDMKSPAGKQYNMMKVYVLTDDPVWDAYGSGVSDGIAYEDGQWKCADCESVYCDMTMVYVNPPISGELTHAAIVENGKKLFQTKDADKLTQLYRMVTSAQGYRDEPKTQVMGPYLVLTTADGTQFAAQLMLNSAMLKIDGAFYSYGWDGEREYEVADLLKLFAAEEELPESWLYQ